MDDIFGKTLFDTSWELLKRSSEIPGEYRLVDGNGNAMYVYVEVCERESDGECIRWRLLQELEIKNIEEIRSAVDEGVAAALSHLRISDPTFPDVCVTVREMSCIGQAAASSAFAASALATLVAFERGHLAAVGGTADGSEVFFLFP